MSAADNLGQQWHQPELNYFGSEHTKNPKYLGEVKGRPMVESDMPEGLAYKHPISSYGTPRRLSVYDMSDKTKRSSTNEKGLVKDEHGETGLVGASDFYREPPTKGWDEVSFDKEGNKTVTPGKIHQHVNIGYMQTAEGHRGGGVGRQMFDYMHNTTPEGSTLNVGKAAHDATLHMSKKAEKARPGSVHYKIW